MDIGRLHVITDTRSGLDCVLVSEQVRVALRAGAPTIQVRAKGLPDAELYRLAVSVVAACAGHGATCLVNDRCDVALATGASGAHVGENDLPVAAARRVLGSGLLLGATARDAETARRHEGEGADYLGVGPAYDTPTKPGLPPPLGPRGIAAVAVAVSIPVIAVGGVTAARVPELLAAGAWGVAVVSAVSEAADAGAATVELLAALPSAALPSAALPSVALPSAALPSAALPSAASPSVADDVAQGVPGGERR